MISFRDPFLSLGDIGTWEEDRCTALQVIGSLLTVVHSPLYFPFAFVVLQSLSVFHPVCFHYKFFATFCVYHYTTDPMSENPRSAQQTKKAIELIAIFYKQDNGRILVFFLHLEGDYTKEGNNSTTNRTYSDLSCTLYLSVREEKKPPIDLTQPNVKEG